MRPNHLLLVHWIRCVAPLACVAIDCAPTRMTSNAADASRTVSGDEEAGAMGDPDPTTDVDDAMPTTRVAGDDALDEAPDGREAMGDDAADDASAPPAPGPPFDAGEGGVCTGPPGSGDLVIDELMISSVAGTGDHGEWLEVASTLGCALDLRGLHGSAPSGSKVQAFDVGDDLWIPAFGTFVIADSSIAAINHDLPGALVVWAGQPGDVLRNPGSTVTLQYDDVIVDSVTYPSMTLTVGASLTFARGCPPATRGDWTRWQPSAASWFPGFRGTPNAPNDDVRCP
jgi:hypothetical protein